MKNSILYLLLLLCTSFMFGQAGHIMQGVGSVNMSMGGAATGQPLDISGAIHWNPAALSTFDENILKADIGFFFSSPELSSTVPEFDTMGMPTGNFFSGTTEDDKGVSPLPSIAMVWGNESSKHTFGVSAFGISGFGVTFPENASNPITAPQSMGGFGRVQSEYNLLQVSFSWAYELSDQFSIGLQPNFDYSSLELMPNPTANPTAAGYPSTDETTALGFGGQIGLYFDSGSGFKAGAAYKTTQSFAEFEFDNAYLDGGTGTNTFQLDYPSMLSFGVGYSTEKIDLAVDYRLVNYENTEGFEAVGWTPTASVAGFGWENMNVISAGLQYKGISQLPLRLGYTYSSNPIPEDLAFFSIPATAIIKNAFQFGLSYEASEKFTLDAVYHYGSSGDATTGQLLNPQFIGNFPPYGAIPGSEVSYDMTTSMIMVGASYTFIK
ncbi:MAG: outer membrane protein transport protein [Flavobacteriaceae bacterium]|nr:outer membrane protein transport protein [Flavobacteriaceae bacterium]MDH3796472.1 outer membrane protein transport protein [Flavobacteriaceae bacterium]